jgi:hypothetical protein
MSVPPPSDVKAPSDVASIWRIGPLFLIPASILLAGAVMMVAEALRHADFLEGLAISGSIVMVFGLPAFAILVIVEGFLALAFMRGRRSWWRTALVVFPSALLILHSLWEIVGLYPPERRVRRELAHHLGGPVPESVQAISLNYRGGIDPSWEFKFRASPDDFQQIKTYRDYKPGTGSRPERLQFVSERSTFFYLEFDARTGWCKFSKLTT